MNTDTANMRDFEFLGSHFEVTEEFKKYNSTRSEQEIKASEIEENYRATNDKMKDELIRLGLPEEANYKDFVNKLPQTILQAASTGFTELQRYQNSILAGIGKRIIFKYTKNDTVSADDIAAALYIDVEKYFSSFMNEVQQIDEMKQRFQAQREYNRLTRSDPSVIGIGFGFKGAIGAAAGSAVANTGASLIGAIGDGLIRAIDDSKVKDETKKSIHSFKVALLDAFVDLYRQLLAVCKTILNDDLKAEIGALGIKPYKDLSESQLQDINTKMENYDEAYSNGDIQAERYVSQIFNVLNEMPYAPKYYYNLYKVAEAIGDINGQKDIISFAQYLGLDKRIMFMIKKDHAKKLVEIKKMPENNLVEIEKKLTALSSLSEKEAEEEKDRLERMLSQKLGIPKIREGLKRYSGRIFAEYDSTIIIQPDNSVFSIGNSTHGKNNTEQWRNVIAVAASKYHTVGLKSDGTVVAAGSDKESKGACQITSWKNITAIAAGLYNTFGLSRDGTVIIAGSDSYEEKVRKWRDIVAISYRRHLVGLKADGTLVAVGFNLEEKQISSLRDIVAISVGENFVAALKADGTVVVAGIYTTYNARLYNTSSWTDIVAVSAGNEYIVGVKADGSVVATGKNDRGECNVSTWQDVIAVSAGTAHTVGLKADGTLVATGGYNVFGECNVSAEQIEKAKKGRHWELQGLCRYCGGTYGGFFTKKCKSCGREK